MNPDTQFKLEIAKIIVSSLTALLILGLGILIHRITKSHEAKQWANQKVIEKRLQVYENIMPELNDLFCFFKAVGNWKQISPPTVLALKRTLDKKIHIYGPLFSKTLFVKYDKFIHACFNTYQGAGKDAILRTDPDYMRRKTVIENGWKDEWDSMFCKSGERSSTKLIGDLYGEFVNQLSQELGVGLAYDKRKIRSNRGVDGVSGSFD